MEEVTARDVYNYDSWLFFGTFCVGVSILRYIQIQLLQTLSRSKYAERTRITKSPIINEKQLERESVWPQGFLIDLAAMFFVFYFDCFKGMEMFQWKAIFVQLIFHCTVVEFLYYWFHRALHVGWLFKKYHAYHHASINTEPTTSLSFEVGERLAYTVLFAFTPIASYYLGYQSYITFAIQMLWFDLQNGLGHINFEFLPCWFYESPLAAIWYSPSYHSIHHTRFKKNFSLFMPWPDLLFGTCDMARTTDVFYQAIDQSPPPPLTMEELAPKDFAFVVHAVDVSSFYHSKVYFPCCFLSNKQYFYRWWMNLLLPATCLFYIYHGYFNKGYHLEDSYVFDCGVDEDGNPRRLQGQTYIVHNPGLDYLLPFKYKQLNRRISGSIMEAQRRNVRVCGLAALNKAEWLNHGGSDIVRGLGDQLNRSIVTHGDTLTSAVVLQNILSLRARNYWNHSVFMIGATSKIGRVVCLALASRKIKVYMFTQSEPRFREIRDEAGEFAEYLVQCTKLSEGIASDLWVTGKYEPSGQTLLDAIPRNTTVLNFAVPDPLSAKLVASRPDIVHLDGGFLAYDTSKTTMNFSLLLPPGILYACMVGCIVHSAMKMPNNEIGPVKLEELDVYWEAAVKCGFFLPRASSFLAPINIPERRIVEV